MAQTVNLREAEYQTIVTELSQMHTDQLRNVEDFIAEMKMMVTSQEIFWANKTSAKMVDMLDVLSNDIMTLVEQAFQDSEARVANMIASTVTTDTACG